MVPHLLDQILLYQNVSDLSEVSEVICEDIQRSL